jgi:hypothetical protein
MSIIVRVEQPHDEVAILRVNELAFGRPDEARIVAALREALPATVISLVAVNGLEVVGYILFSSVTIDASEAATRGSTSVRSEGMVSSSCSGIRSTIHDSDLFLPDNEVFGANTMYPKRLSWSRSWSRERLRNPEAWSSTGRRLAGFDLSTSAAVLPVRGYLGVAPALCVVAVPA